MFNHYDGQTLFENWDIQEGERYAVLWEGRWHRGEVITVINDNTILVSFIRVFRVQSEFQKFILYSTEVSNCLAKILHVLQ